MADHWYWQTAGEQYGPLSTAELEDLIRRNRVQDADQIRVEGSADWLPAAQVRAMFAAPDGSLTPESLATGSPVPESGVSPETGAQSAARVLAGIERQRMQATADEVGWSEQLAALIGKTLRSPFGFVTLAFDLLCSSLGIFKGLFGRKLVLGVIGLVLLAIVLKNLEFGDRTAKEAHEQIAEAWDELQEMKNRKASPEDLAEFERETVAWLNPTLKSLGESAIQNETGIRLSALWSNSHLNAAQAQRSLIAAGGVLKESLAEAARPRPQSQSSSRIVTDRNGRRIPPLGRKQVTLPPESRFVDLMSVAQGFLNGEIKNRAPLATAAWPAIDPLLAGFVVVDLGIVTGGVTFWWRRKRRKTSRT